MTGHAMTGHAGATVRRLGLALAAALAVGSLALAGCGGGGSGGPAGASTIKVASSAPLSGEAAAYGVETMDGVRLAVKEINGGGGIDGKQIELTEYDDQCEATPAATAANKIISDTGVVAVIGNVCSSATLAQMPIFNRTKLPVLAATASSPKLAEQGYANFSRIIPSDNLQGAGTVDLGTKVLGFKRIAVLYPSDDYGQALLKIAQDAVKTAGADLVAKETYVTGSTSDFSAVLSNIAAADPDAVFLAGYYADMGAAVSQSARAFGGKQVALLANAQDQVPEYVKLAGKAGDGTWVTNVYDVTNTSEANQTFVKAYQAAYQKEPGVQAAAGYDNVYVLKRAIEDNGGSTENLAAAIRKITYEGAMGKISFDQNGDNVGGSLVVLQLKGDTWVFDKASTEKLSSSS